MENAGATNLEIYFSSSEVADVTVMAPLEGYTRNFVVSPGVATRLTIPLNFMPLDEGVTNLGLHIVSDVDISVYSLNKRRNSADATVILPTPALGKEYYVVSHIEPIAEREPQAREASMLIVATEDNTLVEITPSEDTFEGLLKGVTTQVTLNAGETYELRSANDLTGTYVQAVEGQNGSCGRIAVFGGNPFTNVGGCGGFRDHLIEQMFPVSTWGQNFLFVPYETRQGGDYVKIVASEDGTTVTIDGEDPISLDAGGYYINKALDGVRNVSADKPITFAQFSRSQLCDGVTGDPFMILVSPIEQRVNSATFNAFVVDEIDRYYLTLVTTASSLNNILLDGVEISNLFIVTGDKAYYSQEIARGNHTITAEDGVIAYVYGYGNAESFGYSAGVSLKNLNLDIVADDEDIGIVITQACVGSLVDFTADFEVPAGEDPRFNTFEWDFGDGNSGTGANITYTYTQPGEYTVVLVASDGGGACSSNSETIEKIIQVEDIVVNDMIGPLSVCPDVDGISYQAIGPAGNTYQWIIDGGDIVSGANSDEVIVNWNSSRNDASLKLIPTNSIACIGDTITYNVVINKLLEPADPKSDSFIAFDSRLSEVCYSDRNRVRYFTDQTNGSNYNWTVIGGTFTADTDPASNEVFVDWGNSTNGQIFYLESNTLIDDCDGTSEITNVIIYNPITATPTISNVLCNGESNGIISLSIAGGKPGDYTVSWSNGETGLEVTGLAIGDYTATITDELGCQTVETYTVMEPDVLMVTDVQTNDVRCFQESNGTAEIVLSGGTRFPNGDFVYNWTSPNGFSRSTNTGLVTDFPAGSYEVDIRDANGCETSTSFVIGQPTLLEEDIQTLINEPICPQASDGTAFIDAKGGTPDYQFFWSNASSDDNPNASNLSKGAYTVTIVDANGCTDSFSIEVTERFPRIFIPNAFSPNGDGENDEFKPVADCSITFSMQIYNNWGSVVFSTEDVDTGWDGNFGGAPAPNGKYSYVVFYAGSLNDVAFEETFRGSIKLIR